MVPPIFIYRYTDLHTHTHSRMYIYIYYTRSIQLLYIHTSQCVTHNAASSRWSWHGMATRNWEILRPFATTGVSWSWKKMQNGEEQRGFDGKSPRSLSPSGPKRFVLGLDWRIWLDTCLLAGWSEWNPKSSLAYHTLKSPGKYKEVQIHGEIDLTKNVERIVINERHKARKSQYEEKANFWKVNLTRIPEITLWNGVGTLGTHAKRNKFHSQSIMPRHNVLALVSFS